MKRFIHLISLHRGFSLTLIIGLLMLSGQSFASSTTACVAEDSVYSYLVSVSEPNVKCYPNPATAFINFQFSKNIPSGSKLAIYSFTGRKISEVSITNEKMQINLDNYFRGLYLFQITQKNGEVLETGKFQVLK